MTCVCFSRVSPKLCSIYVTPQNWSHMLSRHYFDTCVSKSDSSFFVCDPFLLCLQTMLYVDYIIQHPTISHREIFFKRFNYQIGLDGYKRNSYACVVIVEVYKGYKNMITAYPVSQDYLFALMFSTLHI